MSWCVVILSALKTKYKVLMFLSSYAPLFVILFFKVLSQIYEDIETFNKSAILDYICSNTTVIVVICAILLLIIVPNIILGIILWNTKSTTNPKQLKIHSVKKMNHIYMEYLISYIIPFLSFNFNNVFDMIALLFLLMTICIIYINSDLLYINIVFNVCRYNLFKVNEEQDDEYMILTKKKHLKTNEILKVTDISGSNDRFVLDIESGECL